MPAGPPHGLGDHHTRARTHTHAHTHTRTNTHTHTHMYACRCSHTDTDVRKTHTYPCSLLVFLSLRTLQDRIVPYWQRSWLISSSWYVGGRFPIHRLVPSAAIVTEGKSSPSCDLHMSCRVHRVPVPRHRRPYCVLPPPPQNVSQNFLALNPGPCATENVESAVFWC